MYHFERYQKNEEKKKKVSLQLESNLGHVMDTLGYIVLCDFTPLLLWQMISLYSKHWVDIKKAK